MSETGQVGPAVGDYFVYMGYGDSYGVSSKPIAKLSEKLAYTAGWKPGHFAQTRRAEIVFYGTADACSRLVEQIKSSRALRHQEQRAADKRHDARVDGLIAKATVLQPAREGE